MRQRGNLLQELHIQVLWKWTHETNQFDRKFASQNSASYHFIKINSFIAFERYVYRRATKFSITYLVDSKQFLNVK